MVNNNKYDEIYNKNYMILQNKSIDYLMNILFNGTNSFLKSIAKDVIINDNRLEECYDKDEIDKFMDFLSITELWYYRGSENKLVQEIATEKLINVLCDADAKFKRDQFHLIK